jgi:hypothetical protein
MSLSPVHLAGARFSPSGRGVAGRFPRLIRVRDDKGPTQATSAEQVCVWRGGWWCVSVGVDGDPYWWGDLRVNGGDACVHVVLMCRCVSDYVIVCRRSAP